VVVTIRIDVAIDPRMRARRSSRSGIVAFVYRKSVFVTAIFIGIACKRVVRTESLSRAGAVAFIERPVVLIVTIRVA